MATIDVISNQIGSNNLFGPEYGLLRMPEDSILQKVLCLIDDVVVSHHEGVGGVQADVVGHSFDL